MNMYFYRIFILLMVFIWSCQQQDQPTVSLGQIKNDSVNKPPPKRNQLPPKVLLLSEQPEPSKLIIPVKSSGTHVLNKPEGSGSISLIPPKIAASPLPVSNYKVFGTEDGLPLSGISKAFRDSKGILWFATQGAGVSYYDGKSFSSFNTANGLGGNTVWCIAEDASGNIWFGTDGAGLSRYDGKKFTNYTMENGIVNNTIWCLFKDSDGLLWIGTNGGGVNTYDGKKFSRITSSDGMASNYVRGITEDTQGKIWIATNDSGVSCYDPSATPHKDKKAFTNYTTRHGLAYDAVACVFRDHEGAIWFGTEGGGASRFDGKSFTNLDTSHGLAGNIVWRIYQSADHRIWFGSKEGGLSYYDGKKKLGEKNCLVNFSKSVGVENKNISDIMEGQDGSLWFGTNGNGLIRYAGNSLVAFHSEQGVFNSIIWSITQDRAGTMWIGTNGTGVCKFDGSTVTTYTTKQGLADNIVWCITEDKKGRLWFGTMNGGVSCFDGNSFTSYRTEQGLAGNNVRSITEDSKGKLWFGTLGSGVSCFDGKSFTNYAEAQGLAGNTVRSITEDSSGNLWFSSNGGGVCMFNGSIFTTFNKDNGLAGDIIFCITRDQSGMLWFGSEGGGISRYDGRSFLNFTTRDGLPDNVIYDIQEDSSGKLWFGTNLGLATLSFRDPKNMSKGINPIPAGRVSKNNDELKKSDPVWEIFNEHTGYPIKDLNTNAMYITKSPLPTGNFTETNTVWGGCGNEKIILFNSYAVRHNSAPPHVVIQRIKIKEETIPWYSLSERNMQDDSIAVIQQELITYGEKLTGEERKNLRSKYKHVAFTGISSFNPVPQNLVLPYLFNNVTIEFNAIETGRHFMVNYQYRLKGQDDEWSPVTSKSEVTYNNLSEGAYTFLLKAQSPDGVWSEPREFAFTVLPPWFRTWWAYMCYAIAAAGILYGLYLWRTTRLRKEKEMLEEKVRQRTSEVVEQKELADQQRKRAEQSEKIKEIFLASMSHEIRTPINAVTGMTRLLLEKDPRKDQLKYLESIRNASDSLLLLVNHILDLTKIEAGKVELEQSDFSLMETVNHAIEIIQFKAEEKGLSLQLQVDASIPTVLKGDSYRLSQILINLLSNAVKFTDKGNVRLTVKAMPDVVGRNNYAPDDDPLVSILFQVTDTGIGMSESELKKLFQQYTQATTQTASRYGGTGLGLSISKELVELMGGKLDVKSKAGSGSTFTFQIDFLVSKNKKLHSKEKVISADMLISLSGIKVLLADDNEYNRIVASETLQLKIKNIEVDEANDGLMAARMALEKDYDIILMDVVMPEMNGYEATQKIRLESNPKIKQVPILALTASVLNNDITKCLQAGMNGYIRKPYKSYELIGGIYEALHKKDGAPNKEMLSKSNTVSSRLIYIDVNCLWEMAEGDEVRRKRFIELFIQKVPVYMAELLKSGEKKDLENIRIAAHSIKPLFSFTGVHQGLKLAETIEEYCNSESDFKLIQGFIHELSIICKEAIQELKSME